MSQFNSSGQMSSPECTTATSTTKQHLGVTIVDKVDYRTCSESADDSDRENMEDNLEDNDIEDDMDIRHYPANTFILNDQHSTGDRIEGVNQALEWLKNELKSMKVQDRELARTMIHVRSQIQEVHKDLQCAHDKGYDSESENNNNAADTNGQSNLKSSVATGGQQTGQYLSVGSTVMRHSGGAPADKEYKKLQWNLIAADGAFPTDSMCFEMNKRATWAV